MMWKTIRPMMFAVSMAIGISGACTPSTPAAPAASETPAVVETVPAAAPTQEAPAAVEGSDAHAAHTHGDHTQGDHAHGEHAHAHEGSGAAAAPGTSMEHHGMAAGTYNEADVVAQPGAQVGQLARCPISGEVFQVEETSAYYDHEGQRYYFCCPSCIRRFQRDPSQYL